jgi:hypothetical protein
MIGEEFTWNTVVLESNNTNSLVSEAGCLSLFFYMGFCDTAKTRKERQNILVVRWIGA